MSLYELIIINDNSFLPVSITSYYHPNSAVIALELLSIVCWQFVGSQGTQIKTQRNNEQFQLHFNKKCDTAVSPSMSNATGQFEDGFEQGLKLTWST